MAKCEYRARPSDNPNCGMLADAGKALCPRHAFLGDLKAQQEDGRQQARATGASRMPKTRRALLEQGYHYTGDATCKGCNQLVEWWRTKVNKAMPFNRMAHDDSLAVTHFATCTRAKLFRRAS